MKNDTKAFVVILVFSTFFSVLSYLDYNASTRIVIMGYTMGGTRRIAANDRDSPLHPKEKMNIVYYTRSQDRVFLLLTLFNNCDNFKLNCTLKKEG